MPAPAPVDAVQLDIKQEKTPESKFLLPSNTVLVPDPPAEQVLPGRSVRTLAREAVPCESRATGWPHSPITMGPEPKAIRSGATLHSMCVVLDKEGEDE